MLKLTGRERWTRIRNALLDLETLVDAAGETDGHPDQDICLGRGADMLHGATSMADYAIDGDHGVDPPPRGASRDDWSEAVECLNHCTDQKIRDAIRIVKRAFRGQFQEVLPC